MSNQAKGEFQLTLAGTTLTFKVGTAALIAAQEHIFATTAYLPSLEELMSGVVRQRLLYMQAFLWGGLRKYHKDITLDALADLLDSAEQVEVLTLLHNLGMSTVPDPADAAELKPDRSVNPQEAQGGRKRRGSGGARSTSKPAATA